MALMSVPYLTMTSSRSKTARLSDLSEACIPQCVLSPPLACKYTASIVAATRGIRAKYFRVLRVCTSILRMEHLKSSAIAYISPGATTRKRAAPKLPSCKDAALQARTPRRPLVLTQDLLRVPAQLPSIGDEFVETVALCTFASRRRGKWFDQSLQVGVSVHPPYHHRRSMEIWSTLALEEGADADSRRGFYRVGHLFVCTGCRCPKFALRHPTSTCATAVRAMGNMDRSWSTRVPCCASADNAARSSLYIAVWCVVSNQRVARGTAPLARQPPNNPLWQLSVQDLPPTTPPTLSL